MHNDIAGPMFSHLAQGDTVETFSSPLRLLWEVLQMFPSVVRPFIPIFVILLVTFVLVQLARRFAERQ